MDQVLSLFWVYEIGHDGEQVFFFRLRYKVVLTSAKPCELMMDDSALSKFGDCGVL